MPRLNRRLEQEISLTRKLVDDNKVIIGVPEGF